MNVSVKKSYIIAAASLVLLVVGVLFGAPMLLDKQRYVEALTAGMQQWTGQKPVVRGDVRLKLLPAPTLDVADVQIEADPATAQPTLKVEHVVAEISWRSLFTQSPQVTGLILVQPVLEVARNKEGSLVWGWVSPNLLTQLASPDNKQAAAGAAPAPEAKPVALRVLGGKLLLLNEKRDGSEKVERLSLSFVPGAGHSLSVKGGLRWNEIDWQLQADFSAVDAGGKTPFSIVLESGLAKLTATGTRSVEGEHWKLDGNVDASSPDVLALVPESANSPLLAPLLAMQASAKQSQINASKPQEEFVTTSTRAGQEAPRAESKKEVLKLPIGFVSKLQSDGLKIEFPQASYSVGAAKGEGYFSITLAQVPTLETRWNFEKLNVGSWQAMRQFFLPASDVQTAENNGSPPPILSEAEVNNLNPFPTGVNVGVELSTKELAFDDGQSLKEVALKARLADRMVKVEQLKFQFAQNASMAMNGTISYTNKGLRFEGAVDSKGEDVRALLVLMDPSAAQLPFTRWPGFGGHANLFISNQQVRISEADMNLGELGLKGGVVAFFDQAQPRMEAEIRLKDINLDYFRNQWREARKQAAAEGKTFTLLSGVQSDFTWLRNLRTKVDFKITVENFTFLERSGPSASFVLYANTGEVGLYSVKMNYPDGSLDGNLLLNVKQEVPLLDLIVTVGRMNTNYLAVDPVVDAAAAPAPNAPTAAPAIEAPRWSSELFDFSSLAGWRGEFDVNIGALEHRSTVLENFKLKASLANNLLQVKKLGFGLWGGGIEAVGALLVGKVPGVSASFTMYNAEVRDLVASISKLPNLSGRVSLSGALVTQGIHPAAWVSNLDAKMALSARGLLVRNFNTQAVLDTVNAAHSVSDVVKNVKRVMLEGNTEFSADGSVNFEKGSMRSPGITLKSSAAVANFVTQADLIPWKMSGQALFQFPSLPSDTIPSLDVQLSGTPDGMEIQADTSSLEAYVAKRVVGK